MKIAVASGKGGTGKTTVSISLALSLKQPVTYLDCDVEEPNGELFLKLTDEAVEPCYVLVPEVDTERCNGCGDCAELCQFNAIVSQGRYAMVFPELCHSCGGCIRICPHGALSPVNYKIGQIKAAQHEHIHYVQGKLDIGMAMSPPLIKAVKDLVVATDITILDSPPGTSCPMITTVQDADFVLLVTEPTPFGLHDLRLAVETVRELTRPFAVIVNRCDDKHSMVHDYCAQESIEVVLTIPDSLAIARASSCGQTLVSVCPELKAEFRQLVQRIGQWDSGG